MARSFENIPKNPSKNDITPHSSACAGTFLPNGDAFVKSPISALRFISLSLRRTLSTPHSTRFARLELGLFTKSSHRMSFL
jgi:hypothetical protein